MADQEVLADRLEVIAQGAVALTARALVEGAHDLTLPQWRVLVVVGERTEGTRVGEIAEQLGAALPSASRMVRRLERNGLVATARDERDRRATLVRPTPTGMALRTRILHLRRAHLLALVAQLPHHEQAGLETGLEVLADAFRRAL